MKKQLQLLIVASACLFGAGAWAVDPVAVWLNFDGLTADSPLAPQISASLNNIDGRAWAFYLGGGTVNGDKSLQTKGNQAPYISLGSGGLNIGYDNKSITILLAIEAPLTPQENKPILSAQASSGNNEAGFATTSANDVTQIKGTLNGSIWSDNSNPGFDCLGLAADSGTIYLAVSMFHSSHGSSLGVITPGENGSVAWNDVTGLKSGIYSVNNLYFGNFRDGTSGGLDYKLKGVAVYPTAYADDASLLAGVELLSSTEPAATYTWSNADAAGTAAVRDAQRSVFTFCIPAGNGVEIGDVVNISSITMGKAAMDATTVAPRMGFDATFNNGESNTGNSKVSEGTLSQAVDQTGTIQVNKSTSTTALKYIFENGVTAVVGKSYLIGLYAANNENWWASGGTGVAPYLEVASSAPIISSGDTTYAPVYVIEGTVTATPPLEITEDTELAAPSRVASIAAGKTVTVTSGNVTFVQNATIGASATLIAPAGSTIDLSRVNLGENVVLKVDVSNCWGETDSPYVLPEGAQVTFVQEGNLLSDEVLTFDAATGKVKETEPLGYELTWMPIGDSITEGEANMGTESDTVHGGMGYRYHLWKQLEEGGQLTRTVGYRTGHCGVNEDPATVKWAWHCAQYSGSIQPLSTHAAQMYNIESAFENAGYPDVISVLIGINDLEYSTKSASGLNTTDSDTMNKEQADLIYAEWVKFIEKIAKNRPHSKIVVSTLLPVRSTGQSGHPLTEKRRKLFNAKMRLDAANPTGTLFENSNIIFVDVAELAFGDEFNGDLIKSSTDWAHPNEEGSKLVAKAFRLGFLKAIKDIQDEEEKTPLAITQVHNGESGKVVVRLNKPVNPQDYDMLTLALDGKSSAMLDKVTSDSTELTRELYFDASLYDFTFGQFNEATIKNFASTSIQAITSNANTHMDICGSGAAKNVPASFLPNTYQKYATITIHDNADNTGTSANDDVDLEENAPALISRVGYYVELKRENQPAQFVWVSMDAGGEFQNSVANVGLPESKIIRGYVENLQVYGNRGNFDHEVSEAGVRGWVEFSPYEYGTTDRDDAPAEVYAGVYGWNDTLEEVTSHLGCMQVARVLKDSDATWNDPAAEMLFGYSEFRTSSYKSSLGIGSLSISRSDTASNGSLSAATYDWTFASQFSAYQASRYDVKKIEIWVEEMPKETWIGGADDVWSDNSKWADGTAPESTEIAVELQAGSILTLTGGNYSTVFSGDGALAIAKDAKVTLTSANSYEGGTHIAAGAVLTASHANALGTTGAITGSGTLKMGAGLFPANRTGLNQQDWSGCVTVNALTLNWDTPINALGNADSSIEFCGDSSGYFGYKNANNANVALTACTSDIILTGNLTVGNGANNQTITFSGALTGKGTFTHNWNGGAYTVKFEDATGFTGEMEASQEKARILLGTTGTAEAGKIVVSGTANIAAGKTWSANGGVKVVKGGTLNLSIDNSTESVAVGDVSGDLEMAAGSTLQVNLRALPKGVQKVLATSGNGTVTLNGTTTVTIPNGESTQTVSGWTSMTDTDGVYLRRKGFMLIVK